jgi:tetratricopeptide (TPR) repeat protein
MKNLKILEALKILIVLLGLSFILVGCGSGAQFPKDEVLPPVDGGDGGAALSAFIEAQLALPVDDYSLIEPVENEHFCVFDQTVSYLWAETVKGAADRTGKIAEISKALENVGEFETKTELTLKLEEEQVKNQAALGYVQRAVVEKKLNAELYKPELVKLKALDEKLKKEAREVFRDTIARALDAYEDAPKAVDGYDKMLICTPVAEPCDTLQVSEFKQNLNDLKCDEAYNVLGRLIPTYCYELKILAEAAFASECPPALDCQKLFENADGLIGEGDCSKARPAMQTIDSLIALKYCEGSYPKAKFTFEELIGRYKEVCARTK